MTNADKIRQMTDTELAKFLNRIIKHCIDGKCELGDSVCPLHDCCSHNYDWQRKWLKQEAKADARSKTGS